MNYPYKNKFIENKYCKWYFSIISSARSKERTRNNEIYYEKHHILPKSIFPEYKTEIWNIVLLRFSSEIR